VCPGGGFPADFPQFVREAKLVARPDGLTLHALRRPFASVLVALGRDPAYVMGQMGHTDPTLTLSLYAKVMSLSRVHRSLTSEGRSDQRKPTADGQQVCVLFPRVYAAELSAEI
jgi:integrase